MRAIARLLAGYWRRRRFEEDTAHLSDRMRQDIGLPPREKRGSLWAGRL